jgi:thiamine-phosphate pyrophosphorylase
MVAGEAGADYVLFGEPDAKGERPSADAICERLDWWAELFEPPCVGYATTFEEAELFAAAGADFVLAGDFIWQDSRGARTALIEAGKAVARGFEKSATQTAATGK